LITRRDFAVGTALGAVAAAALLTERQASDWRVAIVDRRLAASGDIIRTAVVKGARVIDIEAEDAVLWRNVRSLDAMDGGVAGCTRWSDLVTVRGLLEEKGMRLRGQKLVVAQASERATPFLWVMG
jgi:hypothetical protein